MTGCNVVTETGAAYSQRRCNRTVMNDRGECKRHAAETDRRMAKYAAAAEREGFESWSARYPHNPHLVALVAQHLRRTA